MGTKAKLPYGKRYQKFFQPKRSRSFVRCCSNGGVKGCLSRMYLDCA